MSTALNDQVWNPQSGDRIEGIERGPISRHTLALFAGASNDHSPLHIDSDFVKSAGMPDVFAHGMLVMAYLGHLLTTVVRQEDIREWNTRFVAITPLHATVHCTGEVADIVEEQGEKLAKIRLEVQTGEGIRVLSGDAKVALRPTPQ